MSNSAKTTFLVLLLLYSLGIIAQLIFNENFARITQQLTPLFLLIATIFTLWRANFFESSALKWSAFVIFLGGFIAEASGVAFGFPFGDYWYSSILGLSFLNVPLLIGVNWVLVVFGAFFFCEMIKARKLPLQILLTAIFATLFDIVLEPVAIALNYWQWAGGTPPLLNYLSWFVLSAIFASILGFLWKKQSNEVKGKIKVETFGHSFLIQTAYFVFLFLLVTFFR